MNLLGILAATIALVGIGALGSAQGSSVAHAGSHSAATREPRSPNVVVIMADDLGVDLVGAYGESTTAPCTQNIDALASNGMLFRNAWGNPTCSPARAALLTGRYGFRTGIGEVIEAGTSGLPLSETTIPEALSRYDSTCVGKWHLSGTLGNLHPNSSGFTRFAGFLSGGVGDYWSWQKVVNGSADPSTTYTTIDITNEAIDALESMPEPWFLYVAYNAPHSPFHTPPATLCPSTGCASTSCGSLPSSPTDAQLARAAVEALDVEIGRLLAALHARDPRAFVFFMGDNGTAASVSETPFEASHAKDTLYEGGVNVPLIVRGPGVVHGECRGLVSVVDVFATVMELALEPASTADSVSLVPYFSNPRLSLRPTVYTETFSPNGTSAPAEHGRAIRDERHKLIRITGQPDELFDLVLDPFETNNLLPGLSPGQQASYDALSAALAALAAR